MNKILLDLPFGNIFGGTDIGFFTEPSTFSILSNPKNYGKKKKTTKKQSDLYP